jgi:threonine aldolase
VEARKITQAVDSITFCLSKGLCAPVGSILCGSREFIKTARRVRKHVGGGMRQAGVIAAAGIIALQKMTIRLGEDHARARELAEALSDIPGIRIDAGSPATNMIYFNLVDGANLTASQLETAMLAFGVLIHPVSQRRIRVVTHYWIDDSAVERAAASFREVLSPS